MIYLYWVAVFMAIAMALAVKFSRRIEQTFAPALFVGIIVMYLFGIAGPLVWGLGAISLLGVASGVYVIVQAVRQKQLFVKRWFTPGALILVLMVVYIAWVQGGRLAIGNDEFSHWAYTVKLMDHYDQMSVWHAGEMGYGEYPPATALLEYLFIRLTPSFTEGYLYRALMLLQVSLILPVFARFGWKKLGGALTGFAGLLLLPLAFYNEFYSDLCVDGTLALLFAYMLYAWAAGRRLQGFVTLQLALSAVVLVLTKESGVIFALTALILIGLEAIHQARGSGQHNAVKHTCAHLGFVLGGILAAKISWSILVSMQHLVQGGSGNHFQRIASLFGTWPEKWSLTVASFLEHLFMPAKNGSILPLSPAVWLVFGLLLLKLAGYLLPARSRALVRMSRGLAAGFAIYCVGLLYLYFFQFSEYEATRVASLERYLGSWLLGVVMLGAYLLLAAWGRNPGKNKIGPACVLLAALLVIPGEKVYLDRLVAPAKIVAQEQEQRSAYFTPETFPFDWTNEDRLYFIAEDTAVYEQLCASYSFYPNRLGCDLGYNFDTEGEYGFWANDVSAEELKNSLKEYTYVYLYQISPRFAPKYADLFEDKGDIVGRALYAVDTNGSDVSLRRVWPDAG